MQKADSYSLSLAALSARVQGESNLIANLANASAVLYSGMEDINWLGFYLYKDSQLVLGPFQGQAAVSRIKIGSGVCGTAFQRDETVIVPDVHSFPGHIACDSRSRSEIVVPLRHKGRIMGVLDIDSPLLNRFDEIDRKYLEEAADMLGRASEF